MKPETMVILLKSYYNFLGDYGDDEPKDNLLIRINDLKQQFWVKTGKEFREHYLNGGTVQ